MKTKAIIMQPWGVRAILDGRKTQTRRVIKPGPEPVTTHPDCSPDGKWIGYDVYSIVWRTPNSDGGLYTDRDCHSPWKSPYGATGDLLWVRETWCDIRGGGFGSQVAYLTDSLDHNGVEDSDSKRARLDYGYKWRPSIFMPRWASRLTLRITNVRVERVQDIFETDAHAEGIAIEQLPYNPQDPHPCQTWFKGVWEDINAKRGYSWESNPWVWVVEFEPIHENVDRVMEREAS